ncbi:MAG TPA: nucleoside hydrolase, partial [Trueperaceae bacterium]
MPDNVRAPNTSKPRVIVDCDPGLDDAIALMLAARYCQPLGITTVSGNVGLTHTTRNALAIAELLDCDVPVHAGAERPLLVESGHSGYIHGETGLGATTLPAPRKHPASADAVRFIVDTARREEGVWLLALGPLTNIALALRSAPDIVGRLAGISLMGGSTSVGNVTPAAEFNIWADPEAADMVFASGAR